MKPEQTFLEFTRKTLGTKNWCVARRTKRIEAKYGPDVVCLSSERYNALYLRWQIESYGAPLSVLEEYAPELFAFVRDTATNKTADPWAEARELYNMLSKLPSVK